MLWAPIGIPISVSTVFLESAVALFFDSDVQISDTRLG